MGSRRSAAWAGMVLIGALSASTASAFGPRSSTARRVQADTLTAMPAAGVKTALRAERNVRYHHAPTPAWSRFALMATLPGVKFYSALGYVAEEPLLYDLGDGRTIRFVPMQKVTTSVEKPSG